MDAFCLPVVLQQHQIGVKILDNRPSRLLRCFQLNFDVENLRAIGRQYLKGALMEQRLNGFFLLLTDFRQHLQPRFFFSGRNSRSGSSFQPLHTTGIGHYDAFSVFNDISADIQRTARNALRMLQKAAGCCRCIGHCNRLCTAHGQQHFLSQNRQIVVFHLFFHVEFPSYFFSFPV